MLALTTGMAHHPKVEPMLNKLTEIEQHRWLRQHARLFEDTNVNTEREQVALEVAIELRFAVEREHHYND